MNATIELQVQSNEIALDEQFLRELAELEVTMIGGGEVVVNAH